MKWWQRAPRLAPEIFDAIRAMARRGAELLEIREELARRAREGDLDDVIARSVSREHRVRMFQKTGLDIK